MKRLCFGTFAQVLRLCKLENVIDRKLIGMMTRTVDPNCQYIHKDNASAVSRLFSCKGNLSNGNITDSGSAAVKKPGESISNVVNASQNAKKEEIVQAFNKDVIPLLDEDKKELIVIALLDIIENDDVLDGEKRLNFEKYVGTTKKALFSKGIFALDEFLAGVFLYTVAAGVINTVGKDTVKSIDDVYINDLENSRGIRVVDGVAKKEVDSYKSLDDEEITDKPRGKNKEALDNKVELQNEPIDFDEEFDARVIVLDRALRRLDDLTLIKVDKHRHAQAIFDAFGKNLKNIDYQGKSLVEATGELKIFTENISELTEEWSIVASNEKGETEEGKNISEVFDDIKLVINEYLSFRQDYLLNRKFSISQSSTPQDKMLAIFKQSVFDYRIFDFAYTDPCISLSSGLEMDVEYFVGVIKDGISGPFSYMQKDPLFIRITKFIKIIEAYNSYLSVNMMPMNDSRLDTYVPIHRENNIELAAEFQDQTIKFRKELNSIFGEITNGETLFIYDVTEEIKPFIPFLNYLSAVESNYKELKTLLYDKTPRDFYGFYVCNDLEFDGNIIENINVDRLCKVSNFIIISGIAGLGKSMMMRHLLLNSIDSYDELGLLPIFIQLKNYSAEEGDLKDYVYSTVKRFDENFTLEQLKELLETGKCLLLFDGVDEVKADLTLNLTKELEKMSNIYPKNNFVLSSRPSQQFVALNKFSELELQAFSKQQALKMIKNFDFSRGEQKIKVKFYNQLENALWESHKEFAENPLLLTIMLMTFEEYAEVPSKIHKFYEMAFETLTRRHDDSKLLDRELKSKLSKDEIGEYFEKICFQSYKDEKYEITESEFNNYFGCCQKKMPKKISADDYLYDLSNNLCLLLPDGGKYRFVHRSFQEYFCAKNIKRGFEKVSTDKKDSISKGLIDFFDRRETSGDTVLDMLYDMVPEKVQEFIIIPYLEVLVGDSFANEDTYWEFLERVHPYIKVWYEIDKNPDYNSETKEYYIEVNCDFSIDDSGLFMNNSKLYFFIISTLIKFDLDESTYYDSLEIMYHVVPDIIEDIEQLEKKEADSCKNVYNDSGQLEYIEFSTFFKLNGDYWFSIEKLLEDPQKHKNLISLMNRDEFLYKRAYRTLKKYLEEIKCKQQAIDDEWTEEFI